MAEGPENEGRARHEEDGRVPSRRLRVIGTQEYEIANHHGRRAGDHEDLASVELPAGETHGQEADGSEGVRRDSQ